MSAKSIPQIVMFGTPQMSSEVAQYIKDNPLQIVASADNGIGVISISGVIFQLKNSAESFKKEVDEMISNGINDIVVKINSPGGDVFEANEIVNILAQFSGKKTAKIGALAASAATIVAADCDEIEIAKNGQMMIHRPMVGAFGNEDVFESKLKQLRSVQDTVLDSYVEKTGMTKDEIIALWATDFWMNAKEALQKGFVDRIAGNTPVKEKQVFNGLVNLGYENLPKNLIKPVKNQTPKPDKMEKLPLFAAALKMDATAATPESVLLKVQALVDKNTELSNKVSDLQKKADEAHEQVVNTLIDGAVTAGKITEAEREQYTTLATADYDTVKTLLDAKKPVVKQSLSAALQAGKTDGDPRANWTWMDYSKNAPEALQEMRENEPERYNELFNAQFPKKK